MKSHLKKCLCISALMASFYVQSNQPTFAQNSNKVQINPIEQCVKNKIEYFRKVEGEGPFIRSDMLEEWEGECKNQIDTKPKSSEVVSSKTQEASAAEIGERYYFGDGVTQDFSRAAHYFTIAANQGDAYSQAALGNMFLNGEGVEKNYAEAYKWSQLAAKQNDPTGQNTLGAIYERGLGVPQNYGEAIRYYELAAKQGESNAQNNLGQLYYYGRGVAKNYSEAAKWYKLAAEQGYVSSQSMLGEMYQNGKGVQKNYLEALRLYKLAAEKWDLFAINNLGTMYEHGQGVKQDLREAARLYKLAADKGNKTAQVNFSNLQNSSNTEITASPKGSAIASSAPSTSKSNSKDSIVDPAKTLNIVNAYVNKNPKIKQAWIKNADVDTAARCGAVYTFYIVTAINANSKDQDTLTRVTMMGVMSITMANKFNESPNLKAMYSTQLDLYTQNIQYEKRQGSLQTAMSLLKKCEERMDQITPSVK